MEHANDLHPSAIEHLPFFITRPGDTDVLLIVMIVFLLVVVVLVGSLYFQLHSLPERMAHKTNKVQMEIVAVLGLIALFTHQHIFWIAALLLALVHLPDFSTPITSIAQSLARLANRTSKMPPGEEEIAMLEPIGSETVPGQHAAQPPHPPAEPPTPTPHHGEAKAAE